MLCSARLGGSQGTYTIDRHSNVGFKIRHLVSKVSGEFTDFEGTIVADFENLDTSSVEFRSRRRIDTKNEKRDHLLELLRCREVPGDHLRVRKSPG